MALKLLQQAFGMLLLPPYCIQSCHTIMTSMRSCSCFFPTLPQVVRKCSLVARADDWIRTSMDLFTRQVPFSVEPHRQFSRNAVIRTLSIGFGGRVRSQANIPVWQKPSELSFCGCQSSSSTFQYESLMNLDQLFTRFIRSA
jgi:hypothetical protein